MQASLPEAIIIHVKRDPAATCWSNYSQFFSSNGLGYSYNLTDLVEYYKLYLDLMKFWEKKFPDFIYNLNYEKLIESKVTEIKKIIDFCELDWEDNCLNFSKKNNPIKTVSVTQATKPIYKTSLKTYEKYYDYLDIFKKIENLEKIT